MNKELVWITIGTAVIGVLLAYAAFKLQAEATAAQTGQVEGGLWQTVFGSDIPNAGTTPTQAGAASNNQAGLTGSTGASHYSN